ncbi:MAG: glycosyltransferase family 4 protein [Candidatus Sulfotelmatobacter sp.]
MFFLMVGYERSEEGYRELLFRRAASLGIADHVRVEGYPGPIGDVWNSIDIHVHASQFDSLPNALLEAMSLGKPSVITSVGGVPEVVNHKVNGFLAASNDSEQLAEGLLLSALSHSGVRDVGWIAGAQTAHARPEMRSTWYKIKNRRYSQMAGRHELFERERHREPVPGWHSCALACPDVREASCSGGVSYTVTGVLQ